MAAGVRACGRHPAVFAYLVGNEIPPDMVRWHGPERVRELPAGARRAGAKAEHPARWSATPTSRRPSISTVDFTDFVCFNVYLHDEAAFRRYIARLHNLAVDQPLVLTEFGVDSMREGEEEQAQHPVLAGPRRLRGRASPAPSSSPGPTSGSPAGI